MSGPLAELIRDYERDPTQWDIIRTEAVPSSNMRNRGGSSVQELLRHRGTGEEMVRHTLRRSDGRVFRKPHFRLDWN